MPLLNAVNALSLHTSWLTRAAVAKEAKLCLYTTRFLTYVETRLVNILQEIRRYVRTYPILGTGRDSENGTSEVIPVNPSIMCNSNIEVPSAILAKIEFLASKFLRFFFDTLS